ncbi:hypothetical protein MTR67_050992 [Solanum verrucosum]|uniref:Uncharacterized protein n=1 Tax=Solanum verrucosum TaxID=315347 RepID=A0AAF0V3G7_SOLVR|nr:hypothetical protein MTR67_050992 [Solanum verrucosum]
MVCVSIIFGCKHSSSRSLIISALIIIGSLIGLKILCYFLCQLRKRRQSHSNHSDSGAGSESQLQPQQSQQQS